MAWTILIGCFICAVYVYYCFQIYRKSPEDAKKNAMLVLIGGILFGFAFSLSATWTLGYVWAPGAIELYNAAKDGRKEEKGLKQHKTFD